MFVKQCKAKDIKNMSENLLNKYYKEKTLIASSIKYDGNYVQIHKVGNDVFTFSSNGKRFIDLNLEEEIATNVPFENCILEAEYIGYTDGKLGDRPNCSINSFIAAFKRGDIPPPHNGHYKIFDMINNEPACDRLHDITLITESDKFSIVEYDWVYIDEAKRQAKELIRDGWEGIIVKREDHRQELGKRVNEAMKIKAINEAVLTCYDIEEGKGRLKGLIGALLLEDENGITVKVGSGLSDYDRAKSEDYYIGKKIEIEYLDKQATYTQPVFKRIVGNN